MSEASPSSRLVYSAVVTNANSIVARARAICKGHESATKVLDALDTLPAPQMIVVVGETKKGKSSLVNALLSRPATSPVAVDVATATYVQFQYNPSPVAQVLGVTGPKRFPLDDLPKWVTVDGLAENAEFAEVADPTGAIAATGGMVRVRPVTVGLPVELLQSVSVIDTPGVGGLVGEHAQMTLEAIRLAGSMIFVTDICVPLTDAEADFLTSAVSRAGLTELIIVANMADQLTQSDAATAIAALKERVATHLPTLASAPVVALSARDALDAMDPDLPEKVRATLEASSGLAELRQHMDSIVARAPLLVQRQRLRAAFQAVSAVEATDAAVESVAAGGVIDPVALDKSIRELGWFGVDALNGMDSALDQLRASLSKQFDRELDELGVQLETLITAGSTDDRLERVLDQGRTDIAQMLLDQFERGVAVALTTHFTGAEAPEAPELVAALSAELDTTVLQAGMPITLTDISSKREQVRTNDERVSSGMAGYTGWNMLRSIAGAAFGGSFATPLGVVGGLGMLAWTVVRQKDRSQKTAQMNWARENIRLAKADLRLELEQRTKEVRGLIRSSLTRFTRTRTETLIALKDATRRQASNQVVVSAQRREQARALASEARNLLDKLPAAIALPAGGEQ